MNNLSEVMQARLDQWRKHALPTPSNEKVRGRVLSIRNSKGDYGDTMSLDELEMEAKKSQTRK